MKINRDEILSAEKKLEDETAVTEEQKLVKKHLKVDLMEILAQMVTINICRALILVILTNKYHGSTSPISISSPIMIF